MAPKKKDAGDSADIELKRLQGVIIADWFKPSFGPLEEAKSRFLLPLCGIPLLEVMLHEMTEAGCEEIIVLTRKSEEELRAHIKAKAGVTTAKVKVIAVECDTMADAIRFIGDPSAPKVSGDFLLMSGASLVDYPLKSLVEQHFKAKKSSGGNVIMTRLMSKQAEGSFAPWDTFSAAFVEGTQELLQCVPSTDKLTLPEKTLEEFLKKKLDSSLNVRYGLVDAGVCVCTLEALEKLRDDMIDLEDVGYEFTRAMIASKFDSQITNQYLYVVEAEDCPILRVDDPRGLFDASLAVLKAVRTKKKGNARRPLSHVFPDVCADQVKDRIAPNTKGVVDCLGPVPAGVDAKEVFFAPGVRVSTDNAQVKVAKSIILEDVTLSLNVELEGTFVGEKAVIGDDCEVYQCLLGPDVKLAQPVPADSPVSSAVGEDEARPERRDWFNERVSTTALDDSRSQKEREAEMIGAEVSGEDGLWKQILEERAAAAAEDNEEDNEDATGDSFTDSIRGLLKDAEGRLANHNDIDEPSFVLELKGVRMAENRTVKELVKALVKMLMDKVVAAAEKDEKLLAKGGVVPVWLPMLREFRVVGSIEEGIAAIEGIYEACKGSSHLGAAKFASIMGFLIDKETIVDEAAKEWYSRATTTLQEQKNFMEGEHVKKWFEWMTTRNDESDDDDDDDDSDDSD
jgi:NDP-sugar pyrophosphorylase family protein